VLGLVEGARYHRPAAYLETHPDSDWVSISCRTGTPRGRRDAVAAAVRAVRPGLVVTVNIPDALAAVAELPPRRRPRSVMTCHGIQADLFADALTLIGCVDGLVCTNRLACEVAAGAGFPGDRLYHATHGLPNAVLADPPDRSGHRGPFTVAFVGRLEDGQKRVSDLPAVWRGLTAAVPGARLLVAGDGPDGDDLRAGLAGTGGVEWLGRVPAAEVPARVLDRADALIMPSLWETGPIVIWEAFARGVAVVSSRYVGSGREGVLVDGENCLLFDVGDPVAGAAALGRLAGDRPLRDRLAAAGQELANRLNSPTAAANAWEQAFLSVLEAPPAVGPTPPPKSAGRLDAVLGPGLAEQVRRLTARPVTDGGPGGEWPHALSDWSEPESVFLANAARLDRPDRPQVPVPPRSSSQ
ncbi:glycosyltransferase family 4 protein, partial [Alienimonas chondri]|uniref:glycosyltransferase family 4 protein n=1 Tax=Alienimonas chondri TaxID=2681879 RepID=UPI0019D629B7